MTDNPTPTGTPLPTTDAAASAADRVVQDLIGATEIPVEAAVIAEAPFMATPVLKQIWQVALDWIYKTIKGAMGLITGYVVIDVQQYFALKNAAQALAQLQAAQKSGDPHAISQASQAADQAVAPILHYVGSVQS